MKSSALLESHKNLDLVDVVPPNNGNAPLTDRKIYINAQSPGKSRSKSRPAPLSIQSSQAALLKSSLAGVSPKSDSPKVLQNHTIQQKQFGNKNGAICNDGGNGSTKINQNLIQVSKATLKKAAIIDVQFGADIRGDKGRKNVPGVGGFGFGSQVPPQQESPRAQNKGVTQRGKRATMRARGSGNFRELLQSPKNADQVLTIGGDSPQNQSTNGQDDGDMELYYQTSYQKQCIQTNHPNNLAEDSIVSPGQINVDGSPSGGKSTRMSGAFGASSPLKPRRFHNDKDPAKQLQLDLRKLQNYEHQTFDPSKNNISSNRVTAQASLEKEPVDGEKNRKPINLINNIQTSNNALPINSRNQAHAAHSSGGQNSLGADEKTSSSFTAEGGIVQGRRMSMSMTHSNKPEQAKIKSHENDSLQKSSAVTNKAPGSSDLVNSEDVSPTQTPALDKQIISAQQELKGSQKWKQIPAIRFNIDSEETKHTLFNRSPVADPQPRVSQGGRIINKMLPITSKPPKRFFGSKFKGSPRQADSKDIVLQLEVIRERQEHLISETQERISSPIVPQTLPTQVFNEQIQSTSPLQQEPQQPVAPGVLLNEAFCPPASPGVLTAGRHVDNHGDLPEGSPMSQGKESRLRDPQRDEFGTALDGGASITESIINSKTGESALHASRIVIEARESAAPTPTPAVVRSKGDTQVSGEYDQQLAIGSLINSQDGGGPGTNLNSPICEEEQEQAQTFAKDRLGTQQIASSEGGSDTGFMTSAREMGLISFSNKQQVVTPFQQALVHSKEKQKVVIDDAEDLKIQKKFTEGIKGFNSQSSSRQEREILNHFQNKLNETKSPRGSQTKNTDTISPSYADQAKRLHSQHAFKRVTYLQKEKESSKVNSGGDSTDDKRISSPGLRQSLNLIHYPHVNPGFREQMIRDEALVILGQQNNPIKQSREFQRKSKMEEHRPKKSLNTLQIKGKIQTLESGPNTVTYANLDDSQTDETSKKKSQFGRNENDEISATNQVINDSPFYSTNPMIEVRFDYKVQKNDTDQLSPTSKNNPSASITSRAKVIAKVLVNDFSAANAVISPMSKRSLDSCQIQGISGQIKQLAPRQQNVRQSKDKMKTQPTAKPQYRMSRNVELGGAAVPTADGPKETCPDSVHPTEQTLVNIRLARAESPSWGHNLQPGQNNPFKMGTSPKVFVDGATSPNGDSATVTPKSNISKPFMSKNIDHTTTQLRGDGSLNESKSMSITSRIQANQFPKGIKINDIQSGQGFTGEKPRTSNQAGQRPKKLKKMVTNNESEYEGLQHQNTGQTEYMTGFGQNKQSPIQNKSGQSYFAANTLVERQISEGSANQLDQSRDRVILQKPQAFVGIKNFDAKAFAQNQQDESVQDSAGPAVQLSSGVMSYRYSTKNADHSKQGGSVLPKLNLKMSGDLKAAGSVQNTDLETRNSGRRGFGNTQSQQVSILQALPHTARSGVRQRNLQLNGEKEGSRLSSKQLSSVLGPVIRPRAHIVSKVEEWCPRGQLRPLDRSQLHVKLEPDVKKATQQLTTHMKEIKNINLAQYPSYKDMYHIQEGFLSHRQIIQAELQKEYREVSLDKIRKKTAPKNRKKKSKEQNNNDISNTLDDSKVISSTNHSMEYPLASLNIMGDSAVLPEEIIEESEGNKIEKNGSSVNIRTVKINRKTTAQNEMRGSQNVGKSTNFKIEMIASPTGRGTDAINHRSQADFNSVSVEDQFEMMKGPFTPQEHAQRAHRQYRSMAKGQAASSRYGNAIKDIQSRAEAADALTRMKYNQQAINAIELQYQHSKRVLTPEKQFQNEAKFKNPTLQLNLGSSDLTGAINEKRLKFEKKTQILETELIKGKALLRKKSLLQQQGALPQNSRNSYKNYGAVASTSQAVSIDHEGNGAAIRQQDKLNMLMKIQDVSTMKQYQLDDIQFEKKKYEKWKQHEMTQDMLFSSKKQKILQSLAQHRKMDNLALKSQRGNRGKQNVHSSSVKHRNIQSLTAGNSKVGFDLNDQDFLNTLHSKVEAQQKEDQIREESLAQEGEGNNSKIVSNSTMFDENFHPKSMLENSGGTVRVEDFKEQKSHEDGASPTSNVGTLMASSFKPDPFATHNVSISKERNHKGREIIYSSEFCGNSELKDHKPQASQIASKLKAQNSKAAQTKAVQNTFGSDQNESTFVSITREQYMKTMGLTQQELDHQLDLLLKKQKLKGAQKRQQKKNDKAGGGLNTTRGQKNPFMVQGLGNQANQILMSGDGSQCRQVSSSYVVVMPQEVMPNSGMGWTSYRGNSAGDHGADSSQPQSQHSRAFKAREQNPILNQNQKRHKNIQRIESQGASREAGALLVNNSKQGNETSNSPIRH